MSTIRGDGPSKSNRRALTRRTGFRLVISVIVGGLHTANSAGGLGTGNGLAGGVVALALGLIGLVLGGLALARSRRRTAAASKHGAGTA